MKVVSLLGSAKKKGNTATVLGWVEDELKSLGHQVERIHLNLKNINGCLGCAKCRQFPDEIGCVQKDGAPEILEKMINNEMTGLSMLKRFGATFDDLLQPCISFQVLHIMG